MSINSQLKIIIRADASPSMGTGHVMRTIALALATLASGTDVQMLCRINVAWLAQKLSTVKVPFRVLEGSSFVHEEPQILLHDLQTTLYLPEQTWVVLDGYQFGGDCQKAVRKAGYRLLVIDDYNHLPEYHCDILLNQNIGAEKFVYHGNIGKKLLGLEYVLLRPEFGAARKKAAQRELPKIPRKILLTLGGGNFFVHLQRLAPCFSIPDMRGRTLTVIAGAMSEEEVRYCLRDCPAHIEVLSSVEDMPTLLLDTDLCLCAGGSTCWELCCLRVPFLVAEIAENQRHIIQFLKEMHNVQSLNEKNLASALQCLPSPPLGICDAYGAAKVLHGMI